MAVADIPLSEYLALYDFYNSTNGANWDWRNLSVSAVPWDFASGEDPCKDGWQGITCITTGTLPNVEYHIAQIELDNRNLVGTVPESIGNFTYLTSINVPDNKINGTIPSSVATLSSLTRFGFTKNNLTGTLPEFFGTLSSLEYIGLEYNSMSGHIPDMFNNCTELRFLLLQANNFSGPVPLLEGPFPYLVSLYMGYNSLTGTIPPSLGWLTSLDYVDLDSNYLVGSIPDSFANLTQLFFLGVHDNLLTGTLPEFISTLQRLQYLYLDDNFFTGTLPTNYSTLSSLRFFQAHTNLLHGTIPDEYGDLHEMRFLYLQNNLLSGTIPQSFSRMRFLGSILLQSNRFSGPLTGVFNSTLQTHLNTIQVSSNQLTGDLPSEIFNMRLLVNFVAVSNCFHGSLPDNICNAELLSTLALDGLRTASSCRDTIFPGVSSAYTTSNKFGGTVPICLFTLQFLNTLHLSGNGLTGTLPGNLDITDSLIDLSLSHNILSGDIPKNIQNRDWYNLDLSYNRFGGQLNDQFFHLQRNFTFHFQVDGLLLNSTESNEEASLYLEDNRLSGEVPDSIRDLGNISMLSGNLFSCLYDKSDLPHHDNGRGTYQCGSNSFNIPYYTWMCFTGALCFLAFVLWYYRQHLDRYTGFITTIEICRRWVAVLDLTQKCNEEHQEKLKNVSYIAIVGDVICKVSVWCTIFTCAALIPFYGLISHTHGTHAHEYTYTASAIFITGDLTFGCLLVLFCLLLVVMVQTFLFYIRRFDHIHESLLDDLISINRNMFLGEIARQDSTTALDSNGDRPSSQSLSANTSSTIARQQQEASKFERISVCIAYFLLSGTVVLGVNVAFVYVALYQNTVVLLIAQVLLSFFKVIWNVLCAPYLIQWTSNYLSSEATAHRKASRTGFFSLQLFVSLFNNIGIPCLVVAVIDPNCLYSILVPANTETSSFLYPECGNYGVLGCVALVPAISSSTYSPPFKYSYQCSASFVTYYSPTFVYVCFVATFISPLVQVAAHKVHAWLPRYTLLFRMLDYFLPPALKPVEMDKPIIREVFNPIFDANLVLISLLTYLGIMLTFGAVFPPLGVALAVNIIAVAYFEKAKIGRFIGLIIDSGRLGYLDVIEQECQGMGSIFKLRQAMWMLITFSFAFYSVFLFDTLGNTIGIGRAIWVLLVVPFAPLVLATVQYARGKHLARMKIKRQASEDGHKTEMLELKIHANSHRPEQDTIHQLDAKEAGGLDIQENSSISSSDGNGGSAPTFNILQTSFPLSEP